MKPEEARTRSEAPATVVAAGVVEMSLRGASEDVERLIEKMRREGIPVWRVPVQALNDGRAAGYAYFSVQVPPRDADG